MISREVYEKKSVNCPSTMTAIYNNFKINVQIIKKEKQFEQASQKEDLPSPYRLTTDAPSSYFATS